MKEKYQVEIAGVPLTIVVGESEGSNPDSEAYIKDIAKELDTEIREIVMANQRCGKSEAILLCAINHIDKKKKLEDVMATIENQIEGYKKDIAELKRENDELKKILAHD
jgi:cell division protein ZapA (FtsZ GTPase activity inhibitor)